jgi:UDP-GlcNAc3NAcA epimerase
MHVLLDACEKVCTDSGGLQKEAYWLKKPCITLREETEWIECLHDNWNIIVGCNSDKIVEAVRLPINLSTWYPLYGDGKAAKNIAKIIKDVFY